MSDRRRPSSKPPPAAPSEAAPDLVPRPTRGDRSAGRYSMTSDAPPPRKGSMNPPPAEAPVVAIEVRGIEPLPPSSPIIREKQDVPSLPKIPAPPPVPSLEMPKVTATATATSTPTPRIESEAEAPKPTPVTATEAETEKKRDGFDATADVDWQKLWLATQRKTWRSLVVVPAGKEVDVVQVARALASVGSVHLSREVGVIDATQVGLGELKSRLGELKSRTSKGETILVAVKPVKDNPTSAAFAEAADVTLLCVELGASQLSDASKVVDEIGRDRFLGTAVLETKSKAKAKP